MTGDAGSGKDGSVEDAGHDAGSDAGMDGGSDGSLPEDSGPDACSDCPEPECSQDLDCPVTAPVCLEEKCTPCSDSAACSARADTPACDPASGGCVECTSADAAKCSTDSKVCKTGGTTCIACNAAADCTDPNKPICEADACRACTADADCTFAGKVCRESTGQCVECEPNAADATQENCSNGKACDPGTFTCTGAPRGTLNDCEACVSDHECKTGWRCVATVFDSSPHGTYCLLAAPDLPAQCISQYRLSRLATSTLGVADDYCFPNERLTTCEALRVFANPCVDPRTPPMRATCGTPELPGSLCVEGLCTYGCDVTRDCIGVDKCILPSDGGAAKHCDPN
jgi:hypothetical protein